MWLPKQYISPSIFVLLPFTASAYRCRAVKSPLPGQRPGHHADLGQNWSVTLELRKGHQLVKQGVYRSVRHPMYSSIWLWCLAQGLPSGNWLAGWYGFVAFALMYFVRTPREEQMMCESFGEEYRNYMRQTGRLFPRMNSKNDAQTG